MLLVYSKDKNNMALALCEYWFGELAGAPAPLRQARLCCTTEINYYNNQVPRVVYFSHINSCFNVEGSLICNSLPQPTKSQVIWNIMSLRSFISYLYIFSKSYQVSLFLLKRLVLIE